MDREKREALVLVETGDYETALVALRALARVTQVMPPRLALVLVPPGSRTEASALPGTAWFEEDLPPEVYSGLSPQERLFVDAWAARRMPKERPGDQLPWDAPGHIPPDSTSDG
ncbi:hypothetical protein ACFYNL_05850 [Streptomyces sp. NPDC007808]|uniref:hypothetical protein n=1 Tax=Streptomyces sp. NPDC007808 TaxID=3364779 RepID=UPI00367AD0B3